MRRCVEWYAPNPRGKVVDLGAMDVNGSYRELFPANVEFVGVDLEPGPGVDVVLSDVYQLPFEDGSVDFVLSGQMLEHCGQFWRVFTEIARVLKPEGMAFLIAPSGGPVHRYPVDCYRFYPDSYQALADWAGLRLIHSWTDERGPWRDIIGVFQKGGSVQRIHAPRAAAVAANAWTARHPDDAVEVVSGARHYLDVLRDLHAIIRPRLYLEIGVRRGSSLALAGCPAIAVDPDPHPDLVIGPNVRLYRCTSDDFFFFEAGEAVGQPVDLAFIDGMHLAEYVYRDFMNVERYMDAGGVIVVDDIFPNHPLQASRARESQVWTGDVWRFAERLAEKRPDLTLIWLDTAPTGLLLISRLDPDSRALWDDYNQAIRRLGDEAGSPVPDSVIARSRAIDLDVDTLRAALEDERLAGGTARPLDRVRHVQSVRQRLFRVDLPTEALNKIQLGTLNTRYKGLRLAKSPFDMALYMQVIEQLRPATIIEVGTSEGGSAAWLLDQCRAFGLSEAQLISIDIAPPELALAGATFHQADSCDPGATFPHALIDDAPHPWLVIEDSAHTYESAIAVLDYFDGKLRPGDMLVLEDGVLADLEGDVYRQLHDGPNRALAEFLSRAGERYAIVAELCDFYGSNVTYAPNGWLRRL